MLLRGKGLSGGRRLNIVRSEEKGIDVSGRESIKNRLDKA